MRKTNSKTYDDAFEKSEIKASLQCFFFKLKMFWEDKLNFDLNLIWKNDCEFIFLKNHIRVVWWLGDFFLCRERDLALCSTWIFEKIRECALCSTWIFEKKSKIYTFSTGIYLCVTPVYMTIRMKQQLWQKGGCICLRMYSIRWTVYDPTGSDWLWSANTRTVS